MINTNGNVATAGNCEAKYCILPASTYTNVIISPYVNILFVADEIFNYLSYIRAINALVDFDPIILC